MIKKITHIDNQSIFHDFKWPMDLPTFSRYNLFYGWNGSGKTTISRLFRNLEMRIPPSCGEINIDINGSNISGQDFPKTIHSIRVFNRDYVAENIFPTGGGDVPPILILGKDSVEKQKSADKLKKNLIDSEAALESARTRKRDSDKALDNYTIEHAKIIKETLRSSGINRYNNYDKADYRSRIEQMITANDATKYVLSEMERNKLLTQHHATPKSKIKDIAYQPPNINSLKDTVANLLSETVLSSAIESIKSDPELSSWLHSGLKLHQSRSKSTCLFCGNELPIDRLNAFEAHFSNEFDIFLQKLDAKINELINLSQSINLLSLPNKAEFYDDLIAEYEEVILSIQFSILSITSTLASLINEIENKKVHAFERLELNIDISNVDFTCIDRINNIIKKHNEVCDNLQTRADDARIRLEADSIAGGLEEYNILASIIHDAEMTVNDKANESARLKMEISRLEQEIVEFRRPAEELNHDLHKYLGHSELYLEVMDTGYRITRNGELAKALSEGEMTAIALLYFLKSLGDRRFNIAEGVVVLDDPVSSLDANALFLAFGFIRERTKDARQLFILTHNFTFFRQVKNWFHHLKGQKKPDINQRPARFYMLDCIYNCDQRCSSIRMLDPLLENYESDYHYLFARVYHGALVTTTLPLEENYILPNIARRLLEAFLAFRQPNISGELSKKLEKIEYDEAKKLRILRFLHTFSHNDLIIEPEHDPSILSESVPILKDLLEFIENQDPEHYKAMVIVVTPPHEEDE